MPKSSWVWRCTDASIAAEQISILAVFETLIAVGVYWWLALHFEWPWMAFLSMIAAPILLLRSEKSIAHGIQLLRTYWEAGEKEISRRDKIIIFLITILITGLVSYWLITYWLTGYIGWPLFWRATVLGSAAVISTVMVIYAVTVALLALGNEGIKSIGTSTVTCVVLISIVILATIINIATDASIAVAGAIIGIGISVKMIALTHQNYYRKLALLIPH